MANVHQYTHPSSSPTPEPTSLTNIPQSNGPTPANPTHDASRSPPQHSLSRESESASRPGQSNANDSDPLGLETELPPAYTPAADPRQGEHTLEYGPVRPFQQQTPAPQGRPYVSPQPTGQSFASTSLQPSYSQNYLSPTGAQQRPRPRGLLSTLAGELERQLTIAARQLTTPSTYHQPTYNPSNPVRPASTGGGTWSSYPGQQRQPQYGQTLTPHVTGYAPPPMHPQVQHSRSTSSPSTYTSATTGHSSVPTSPQQTSDFARDFYTAGAGEDVSRTSSSSPGPPPPLPSRHTGYAPPPGPPPRPRSASPPRSSSFSSPLGNNGGIPDDGRPTHTPVPGHPLLRDGKLLVYPNGHECGKCHNTGYKHSDPLNPCKKCWQKYAKPYVGALAAAPWGPSVNQQPGSQSALDLRRSLTTKLSSPSRSGGTTFQRPLPQQAHPWTPSHPQPQGPGMGTQSALLHAPQNSAPNAPIPLVGSYPGERALSAPVARMPLTAGSNAVMVLPGDPRLGGRLCWHCGGRGQKSVLGGLLGDEECWVCRGVGRVF